MSKLPPSKLSSLGPFNFLPQELLQNSSMRFPGKLGVERASYFLKLLGSPQNKIKVIHVAGTSGKGSTSYLISQLLISQDYKVGLHLSPPLLDFRERFLINNKMLSTILIKKYLQDIEPQIIQTGKSKYGKLSQFELLAALSYYIFWQLKVDYGVLETGLGGLYDATNTVTSKNKICVITSVDKDHTRLLGNSLDEITQQKAGIIKPFNLVISTETKQIVKDQLDRNASIRRTSIQYISEQANFKVKTVNKTGSVFDFKYKDLVLKNLNLSLLGKFQIKNASLALAVVKALSDREGLKLNLDKLRESLIRAQLKGRFEHVLYKNRDIIFDSAHNPIRVRALIQSLKLIYPQNKFCFLVSIKRAKDYKQMFDKLILAADKIILTQFTSTRNSYTKPIDLVVLENYLIKKNFRNYQVIANVRMAFETLLRQTDYKLVVTGSIYLLQNSYEILEE